MFKKAIQRGRSGGRGRGVPLRYVEAVSDARTKLGVFFNIPLSARSEDANVPLRLRHGDGLAQQFR
jgi:hypothetical protein